jgi:hypothetical protein
MAKKLAEIEERAYQLSIDLIKLRPAQYAAREGNEGNDNAARCWNSVCRGAGWLSLVSHILLGYIEERAGLDWVALEREREKRRGWWPAEAADEGAEEAEKAGS